MKKYNIATLSCGLRIIHLPADSPVVYCGYAVAAGSRHEADGEDGMAHFCEHVTFKGTERRSALQILNGLERVGGDLNAFTNKEDTVFYAAVLNQHLAKAVDLLTDMVLHSTYPAAEVAKEVEVICDEIESYNDTPSELIFDEFENILFRGHPLGHNILGQADRLRSYRPEQLRRFARTHYTPANMVFFACGQLNFAQLVRMVERRMDEGETGNGSWPAGSTEGEKRPWTSEQAAATTTKMTKHTHQTHVMMGCRGLCATDERRTALFVLNNILGGPGMNARLNLALRERRALVYTVESTMACFSDTGLWATYFGCDPHDAQQCMRLVRRELDKLVQQPLSARQLSAAKQQLKGQLAIANDNREQCTLDFAKAFLHYHREHHLSDLYRRIDALSAADLLETAQLLLGNGQLHTLIIE